MSETPREPYLRSIPSVDSVLQSPALAALTRSHPRFPWTALVRDVFADFRRRCEQGNPPCASDRLAVSAWAIAQVERAFVELETGGLRRVLNGTGVILHTNLGRAALGDLAVAAATEALAGYVSLEVDIDSGRRSKRGETLSRLLTLATGAESAMVVNNNAAAVYLAVNTYAPPGRVIVSRGELVEIGGSFRLPEILRHAAGEVVEVGTTNRTYAADYTKAARAGDILLKVHKSNYAIEGFAHEASVAELASVAREAGAMLVYDLGSGTLHRGEGMPASDDPVVTTVIDAGVDAVTMSADKLLGGPQAGIIAGRRAFIEGIQRNPLRRAVRVDKVTIAALQAVLRRSLFGDGGEGDNPVAAQIGGCADVAGTRATAVVAALGESAQGRVTVVEDDATVGGGSLSGRALPSFAVSVSCASEDEANRLARALRHNDPPVFTRVRGAEVRVNMTTILRGEEDALCRALSKALGA